jgi:hypothetical protein
MGLVAERLLIRYRDFERKKEVAKISIANRQAIVAAGIYENPVEYLNEATEAYHNLIYFTDNVEQTANKNKSNEELFEEWKRLFGKIEENSPEES